MKRATSDFGIEEMFAILLLVHAERYHYFSYPGPCQLNSDKSRSRLKIGLHLHGMSALLQQTESPHDGAVW